ncbi:MAG: tripartite tricarboxylate transporter substrate binding protein [Burkholderiales bacterium]|nr:tripartite tricarboxylate transporter substrate binding protein [Burkholderiales bacterium]
MKHASLKLCLAWACLGLAAATPAQEYPARPVTVIIPFSAGSASDVIGRIVLDRIAQSMGRPFVVDNRPAAGGNVGTQAVARAEPDGYTILMSTSGPLAVNRVLNPALGYDPERDLAPISLYASLPNVIVVTAKLPVATLPEFIEHVRKNPNTAYSSVGPGSSQHLAGAYFEQLVGAKMTHVPYRVTGQLVTDLVAGQVPVSFQLLPNVAGQIKAGAVRPIAVAAERRLAALPSVPTAAEAGLPGYQSAAWFAFLGPRGTPRSIIERWHREIAAATGDGAIRARFTDTGAEALASTPEELGRHISAEIAKWRGIIDRAGIKLDP